MSDHREPRMTCERVGRMTRERVTRELRAVGLAPDVARAALAKYEPATKLETLEDVLRWGGHVLDVVVQDEYTHDAIVDDRGAGFLVFDTT